MSIRDLDIILNKEAIIATYPASHLRSNPEQVEQMYRAHAKTHIPLGDTLRYVDTIFKWVGGQNKGSFIGAVVGDYGHGKTSFQVHVWEESTERKVFAVPPFSWKKVSDMIEGTAAWSNFMFAKNHPEQARQAKKIYEDYREKTLRETAEKVSQQTGQDIEDVIRSLTALADQGASVGMEITPDRFLDYCEDLTVVVKEAGYAGLLMLLDEPEVAAKELGFASVSQILFDIANGLLQRQGDYGVFISMPENFLARAQSTFASLPARLQGRSCMTRLRDIYGSDFAEQLWASYVKNFELGEEGERIVKPITLKAIGQVASSERKDLSYGPRTVVSTFRQMVHRYKESKTLYEVEDFVEDCLEDEILVVADYPTRIKQSLNRPEAEKLDKASLQILAGFPNGITVEQAEDIGIEASFLNQAKSSGVVYKRHSLYGLVNLLKVEGIVDDKEPDQTIEDIFSEFAPAPKAFKIATAAFVKHVIPIIYEKRSGMQLIGWDIPDKWINRGNIKFAEVVGAFKQTVKDYPKRKIAIAVGPVNETIELQEFRDKESQTDILIHYLLRWNIEEPLPDDLIQILPGKPEICEPAIIRIVIDLASEPIPNDQLENIVEARYLTPLGILYLIGAMDRQTFPKDVEAIWDAMRKQILRNLPVRFFQNEDVRKQASKKINRTIPSGAVELIPSLCDHVLRERFPNYSTLIKQPQWSNKVKDYIIALQNQNIPLSCKRGREQWKAPKNEVANAFNTNVMNLNNFFDGYDNLIFINMGKRDDDAIVEFKLHPLEERIMETIIAENPQSSLKVDDKECWWVDIRVLFPVLLYTGYQQEEIMQIIEMGKARGTFLTTEHRGCPVLYCKPLDPEQMKTQLREKLDSLKEEFIQLKKLPDFRHNFNFDSIEKKIDSIDDDADFESLKSKIHRAFEQNHDRLETYFNRLEEAFNGEKYNAVQVEQNVSSNRQISLLKNPPIATSKWCSDLSTYIMSNLNQSVEDLRKECRNVKQKAAKSISEFIKNRNGAPIDKIKRLTDGWNTYVDLQTNVRDLKNNYQQLKKHLDDYEQWIKLLSTSDSLYKQLIEMKKDDTHKNKANEFIQEVDVVWNDISELLRQRNLAGLGSYKQYFKLLEDIEHERKKYLQQLRGAFEKVKDKVNQILIEIGLSPDSRTNVVFNPEDSKGCYEQLYNQALEQLKGIFKKESEDISDKRLELLYASNVLKRINQDEVKALLEDLEKNQKRLDGLSKNLSEELIEKIAKKDGTPNPNPDEIKETISKSRESSRNARKVIIENTKKKETSEVSKAAKEMLKLIPDDQIVDLKHVILELLKEDQPTESILDPALKHLSELFRNGKVQIKIELPRKR